MFNLTNSQIAFIGGGNMAQALIAGLVNCGVPAAHIRVSDPVEAIRKTLSNKNLKVYADNLEAIQGVEIVILAVKPQVLEAVLQPLRDELSNKVIISVVAGINIETLQLFTGSEKVIRIMPNTPALVQKGAYGMFASSAVSLSMQQQITSLFTATGLVVWLKDEGQMDAVTALSGSGPAYFFYLMDHMIQAGTSLGLDEKTVIALTLQTAVGAAEVALQSDVSPQELCKRVTSPNGTTQAALEVFQQQHIGHYVQQAIHAATQRSQELAQELSASTT